MQKYEKLRRKIKIIVMEQRSINKKDKSKRKNKREEEKDNIKCTGANTSINNNDKTEANSR